MNHRLTRIITVLCLTFTMLGTLNANQPRMERAILLLQQAQTSPTPLPLLRTAEIRLLNATPNKAGYRIKAIRTVRRAIAVIRQGGEAQSLISLAIIQVQKGIENVRRP